MTRKTSGTVTKWMMIFDLYTHILPATDTYLFPLAGLNNSQKNEKKSLLAFYPLTIF